MNTIDFTVPGIPCSKGRPRFSRKSGHTYTPTKTRKAEETFVALAAQHRPKSPITEPIQLQVGFYLPIPQSKSKKKKAAMAAGETQHTTRPDLDNLLKLVKDAMTGIFWMDDKQIIYVIASKMYAKTPETNVIITWVEGDE